MKILVFGAGPLGSLFAARLQQGGHQVTLLARGKRMADLQQHGIVIRNWESQEEENVQVELVDSLAPDDWYDLVLVIMRKNKALDILPTLARNGSPNILFLMNSAAGPQELMDAVGKDRILIGFPGTAGYLDDHKVVYINADAERPAGILLGEPDGQLTPRLEQIHHALGQGKFMSPLMRSDMDVWLKYHVALLFPSLAPALSLANYDRTRMARTRDILVLAWRAIREGFKVLNALHYPVTPSSYRPYLLLPEPIGVALLKKVMRNPRVEVAMVRHARNIRDEILQLNNEFMLLVNQSGVFTPNIQFLVSQYQENAPALPDGSRSIRLDWTGIILPVLGIFLVVLILIYLF